MNAINWFEIPVTDIERAARFYSKILGKELKRMEVFPGFPIALLPVGKGDVGGALTRGEGYTPGHAGPIIYLNGGEDLSIILDRVPEAGGKILMGKTSLGEHGATAYFEDSEGNRIGLQSDN